MLLEDLKKVFCQKDDEIKLESKLYFLVTDDFDWLKFAKTLKTAADDMIKIIQVEVGHLQAQSNTS